MNNLFPDADYRFQMNLERGSIAEYFRPTANHEEILQKRRHWLQVEPEKCAAMLQPAECLIDESIDILVEAGVLESREGVSANQNARWERCLQLGRMLEPDFLLLIPQQDGQFRLVGACVCFPSSWTLTEKIDRPLDFIHQVVPGLNEQIGIQISRFLMGLRPGFAWLRANWGLSRSGEFNQHPSRNLARLDEFTPVDDIWLRIERQALVLLPQSQGVLFGIRIETHPVMDLKQNAEHARGLARALRTMPEDMAQYKNIATVRERVRRELEAQPSSTS